ncbi:hypothetical protein ScPMuIL_001205 [Solemya velum]
MATSVNSTCRVLYLHVQNVSRCSSRPFCCSYRRTQQSSVSTERKADHGGTNTVETIIVPRRKKRDSLSILRALSSTVGKDFTAAHNRYLDDPFLIPVSIREKQTYTLSRASGKRAAKYMIENHSPLFQYSNEEPKVQAYQPPQTEYAHPEPSEDALMERIGMRRVIDAIEVYKNLRQSGEKLPLETQLRLLELLAVYNCTDPAPPPLPEETVYSQDAASQRIKLRKTWHTNSIVEELFEDLPEKTPAAYNIMTRGMAKYLDVDGAFGMHKEMLDKGIPVERETYHTLIPLVPYYTEKEKWETVMTLLKEMKERNFQANLATFNSILLSLSRMAAYPQSQKHAMKTLVEMQNCGIEPCLGSWYYIIQVFYYFEDRQSNILHDIVSEVEGKQFTVQDSSDMKFFSNAMMKCFRNLKDLDLAYRIDALLHTGNNIRFLNDAFSEQSYSWYFMQLLCMFETMDKIMEYYERIVPSMWTPAASGMGELLKAIELHDGFEHIPRIWSDVVMFDYMRSDSFTEPLFALMTKKTHPEELQSQFADIAEYMIGRWKQERVDEYTNPIQMTATNVSYIIILCLRSDRFESAWSMFQTYKQHDRMFSGILSDESLVALTNTCIEQKQPEKAIECLSVVGNLGLQNHKELAEKILTEMDLSESQKQHIDVLM